MVRVPSPSENPYDAQDHGFPASANQGEVEDVDSETSLSRQEEAEVGDEGCFVRSLENRGVMEGGCEDLGEYPSDRNP